MANDTASTFWDDEVAFFKVYSHAHPHSPLEWANIELIQKSSVDFHPNNSLYRQRIIYATHSGAPWYVNRRIW